MNRRLVNVRCCLAGVLAILATCSVATPCRAAGNVGEKAADFPIGTSTVGDLSLADLRGKVVVLFFYESKCPRCRASIPERNQVVEAYKGKPVVFIAIAAGDSLQDARQYQQETKLAMPVFADTFSAMEKAYGTSISLNNIWQFRVIAPDGTISAYDMTAEEIDPVLSTAQWKFKDQGYPEALNSAVDHLERNNLVDAVKLLRPATGSADPKIKEAATQLYDLVKVEGQKWKDEAESLAETDPVAAFELYWKISTVFAGDELAKSVAGSSAELRKKKEVMAELDARKMFTQLKSGIVKAGPEQTSAMQQYCQQITTKYPDTPTAARVQAFLDQVNGRVQ